MRFTNLALWSILCALAVSQHCMAQSTKGERWRAVDDAAMSITGDIVFFPDHIVFQNGAHINISFVKRIKGFFVKDGVSQDVDLYRVVGKPNPKLLRGNTLCGRNFVTYITIWDINKPYDDDIYTKVMTLFYGNMVPTPDDEVYCEDLGYQAG
jgi:hypothetical protein